MRVLRLGVVLCLLAAAAACGGDDKEVDQPKIDDSARAVSLDELSRMVLTLQQFGLEFDEFTPDDGNGPQTLDSAAAEDFDPAAERADLEATGFANGHQAFFIDAQALEEENGTFQIGSSVGLFANSGGASAYFDDEVTNVAENVGKTRDGVTVTKIERFDAAVAKEGAGVRLELHYDEALTLTEEQLKDLDDLGLEPVSFDFWAAAVLFRHGRLIGTTGVFGIALSDDQRERLEGRLRDLARKLDEQMTAVLASGAPPTAAPAP